MENPLSLPFSLLPSVPFSSPSSFSGSLTEKLIEGQKSPDTSLLLPDLLTLTDSFNTAAESTTNGTSYVLANIAFKLFMLAHISYYSNTMHLFLLLALTVLLSHTLSFSGRCLRFSHWGGFSAGLWSVISYLSWKPICFCSPFFLLLCSSWRWILPGGAASWSDCFW